MSSEYGVVLAAEIYWRVWGTMQHISTGFASWQRYCTTLYSSERQPSKLTHTVYRRRK